MTSDDAPRGGLPPCSRLTTDRGPVPTRPTRDPQGLAHRHRLQPLPHWERTRRWVLARPLSGFAETFSQYLMEVGPGW